MGAMNCHQEMHPLLCKANDPVKNPGWKCGWSQATGVLALLSSLLFLWHVGTHMRTIHATPEASELYQSQGDASAFRPSVPPSSLLMSKKSSAESNNSDKVRWGNPQALEACFGKNYKAAGES